MEELTLDNISHHQNRQKENHRLKRLEVQSHGLSNNPSQNDQERRNQQRNLHRASNGDAHSQVHLVFHGQPISFKRMLHSICFSSLKWTALTFHGHHNGGHMLGSISNDGEEDQTDECLGDMGGFNEGVDGVHEEFGADGDKDGDDDENKCGGPGAHLGLFLLFGFGICLGVEEVGVGAELEDEV